MKTKLKKLAVVWLVVIMLLSALPLQVYGLRPSTPPPGGSGASRLMNVALSMVDTPLNQNDFLNIYNGEADALRIKSDKSLLEQLSSSVQVPSGKTIVGWNIWSCENAGSGYIEVSSKMYTKDADDGLSSDEYDSIDDSGAVCLIEPVFGFANSGNDAVTNVLLILMKRCYINIDLNDGEEAQRVKVKRNAPLDIEDPVREGYVFDGWYLDKECTERFDDEGLITVGINLWAKWSEADAAAE